MTEAEAVDAYMDLMCEVRPEPNAIGLRRSVTSEWFAKHWPTLRPVDS